MQGRSHSPCGGHKTKTDIICPCNILRTRYIINITETQEVIMTQQQFNDTIMEIANKIFHIREYSFGRRGLKFDYRRPNLMLSPCEKERIKALEDKALETLAIFTEQKENGQNLS